MARASSYRDLRVYREGFRLAMEIFRATLGFPEEERFGLTRQVRNSSRSVCANTAEAWRRRVYPQALVAKLMDAEAEATETRVHLEFARACGYLPAESQARPDRRYDRLIAALTTMRQAPRSWAPAQKPEGTAHSRGHAGTRSPLLPHASATKHAEPPGQEGPAGNATRAEPTAPAARPDSGPPRTPPSTADARARYRPHQPGDRPCG